MLLYIYLYIRYKTRVMHILQQVKKMWVFCIYADIFVSEFCLVATKQHPTVIITKMYPQHTK